MDPALAARLTRRGDLSLSDAALGESLLRVSEIWGVNLVVGTEIQGRVTGIFKDAPLYEILDAILLSNGYGYRPVGQSLVIMKLSDLGDLNPMFASAVIPLAGMDPKEAAENVRVLLSPRGKVQAIESARSLLVIDFPTQVAAIRRFLETAESASLARRPGGAGPGGGHQVAQFAPQYVSALALRESLQSVLSPEGKIGVMPLENRLVVVDYPAHLAMVSQLMMQLDIPRSQVRITALIYDISLQDLEHLGVNWHHALKGRHDAAGAPQSIFSGSTVLDAIAVPGAPSGVMTFMNLSRHVDLTAVINALQQASNTRLLANPNVTVVENEPALIAIVTEIPYQQLTQTQQGGNIGTTAFREAGVKLEVIPHISDDGTVQMVVTPSFSRLAGYTPGEQPQPIIDRREARTTVRVASGQTLVIGGLRQRQEIADYSGIPYLKDMKKIGFLFRSKNITIRESELVVFIRPEIVTPIECGLPREEAAKETTNLLLDQVPPANPGFSAPYLPPPANGGDQGQPAPMLSPPPEQIPPPSAGRAQPANQMERSRVAGPALKPASSGRSEVPVSASPARKPLPQKEPYGSAQLPTAREPQRTTLRFRTTSE